MHAVIGVRVMNGVKTAIKRWLQASQPGRVVWDHYFAWRQRRYFGKFRDRREIFTHTYATNAWLDGESVSGPGSNIRYTESLRRGLPPLILRLGIKRILDAPCGDFYWFPLMAELDGLDYVGGDIVAPLIERNQERHGRAGRSFQVLDVLSDPMPDADVWLCRDCLFHLSNRDVRIALERFASGGIPLLLTSTHTDCPLNRDIPTGSFRQLNLQLPPFALPAPREAIEDWMPGFPRRLLALWSREEVACALRL
jgi:SAM-dependent methyltransferase